MTRTLVIFRVSDLTVSYLSYNWGLFRSLFIFILHFSQLLICKSQNISRERERERQRQRDNYYLKLKFTKNRLNLIMDVENQLTFAIPTKIAFVLAKFLCSSMREFYQRCRQPCREEWARLSDSVFGRSLREARPPCFSQTPRLSSFLRSPNKSPFASSSS